MNVHNNIYTLLIASVLFFSEHLGASQFDTEFEDVFPDNIPDLISGKKRLQSSNMPQQIYFFKRYQIQGNSILDQRELDSIIQPYLNREIASLDVIALLNKLTQQHIDRGYINSGVVLAKQKASADTLNLQVISGFISSIDVNNTGRLRESYFIRRLLPKKGKAVNMNALEYRLLRLKQDPLIQQLDANFIPGQQLGEGILQLNVEENVPHQSYLELSNYGSTLIGEEQLTLGFSHFNVSGDGDQIDTFYSKNKDRNNYGLKYKREVGNGDSYWSVSLSHGDSLYSVGSSGNISLETDSDSINLRFAHIFADNIYSSHELFGNVEYSQTKALVDNIFPLQIIADDKGVSKVLALRLGHSWIKQSLRRAFVIKTTLSYGENKSGGNNFDENVEDADFEGINIRSQYSQRLQTLDSQFIFRLEAQKTDSLLFPSEIFSLGGHNTVFAGAENIETEY